jgi:hypothetical protein
MVHQWMLLLGSGFLTICGVGLAQQGISAVKAHGLFCGDFELVVHGSVIAAFFGGLFVSRLPGLF